MYTLTLSTTPPLIWSEPEITELGQEQSAINGEVPNMTVTLDNALGQHTSAVAASSILRLRGDLRSDGVLEFSGAVQAVSIGAEIVIELEA